MKSLIFTGPDNTKYLKFYCPACDMLELIPFERGQDYKGPVWTFSGTTDNPSIHPSVRHFFPAHDNIPERTTCHFILSNGTLNYCNDCPHSLNNQAVPLPEIPDKFQV